MDTNSLKSYARLIAVVGANIQKGQDCVISAGLHQPEFVEMLAEECYLAGAKKVTVEWTHQPLTRLHAKYQTEETLVLVFSFEVLFVI